VRGSSHFISAGAGLLGLVIFLSPPSWPPRPVSWFALACVSWRRVRAGTRREHVQTEEARRADGDFRSPREWAIELRFAPTLPTSIPNSQHPRNPYKTIFGSKRHLMSQLEFDWQFFQAFGRSASAWSSATKPSAKPSSRSDNRHVQTDPSRHGRLFVSGDTTRCGSSGCRSSGVPWDVAPNAGKFRSSLRQARPELHLLEINNGNGNVPDYKAGTARCTVVGKQRLDVSLARHPRPDAAPLDMETGVNHSYVFFEWNHVDASGLG